jgi:hypothetical protein
MLGTATGAVACMEDDLDNIVSASVLLDSSLMFVGIGAGCALSILLSISFWR